MKKVILSFALLLVSVALRAQAPAPAKLAEYAGRYAFGSTFRELLMEEKNGALFGTLDTYGTYQYNKLEKPDTFQSTSSYGTVFTFRRDPRTNAVVGVTAQVMGQEATAEKVP